MATYSLVQAQANLPELVERAGRGEAIVLSSDQGVTVKLTLVENVGQTATRRQFGRHKGKLTMSDDVFEPVMSDEDYDEWLNKL